MPADVPSDPFDRGAEIIAAKYAQRYGLDINVVRAIVHATMKHFEVRLVYGETPKDFEVAA